MIGALTKFLANSNLETPSRRPLKINDLLVSETGFYFWKPSTINLSLKVPVSQHKHTLQPHITQTNQRYHYLRFYSLSRQIIWHDVSLDGTNLATHRYLLDLILNVQLRNQNRIRQPVVNYCK